MALHLSLNWIWAAAQSLSLESVADSNGGGWAAALSPGNRTLPAGSPGNGHPGPSGPMHRKRPYGYGIA
jgi:hypothetical protein